MSSDPFFDAPTNRNAPAKSPTFSLAHRSRTETFLIGLLVRLIGAAMIWLGNGSDKLLRKGVVVLGVILSVGGIGILKYLMMRGKPGGIRWPKAKK